MVERHLALAQRVARQVDEAPDLERLAEVPLNVVCFRFRPPGVPENQLDALNRKLGESILEDGRVYFGTTEYAGKVAFRPAIVNWRTGDDDVDLIAKVVRELGSRLVGGRSGSAARGVGGFVVVSITTSRCRAIRFISRSPRSRRFTICRRISS